MDRKAQVEAAFLEWINSFPFPNKVASLKDLNDGLRIWDALRDIDPGYFTGDLPEGPSDTGKWPSRWQNLKHIIKSLLVYIQDECGQPLPNDPGMGDLQIIALVAETGERIVKLLKLVLIAAINSPKATEYIAKMPTLSTSTQAFLKESIEELQDSTNPASDNDVPSTPATLSPPPAPVDLELFVEERFGKVMADNERFVRENQELRKNVQDLQNRLGRLQDNNAVLQERLVQAEDSLQLNASTEATIVDSSLKALRIRIQEQEDIIATQESTISEYETNTEALQKTVDRNHVSSSRLQKLQDEMDELKVERDGLAKKANTVDKYKQKLQASQDLEKDNELLRAEIDDIRQNTRSAGDIQEQLDGLQQAVDEYKEILPRIEQDRHELQMMKTQLEVDNAALAEKWEAANEQHTRDQDMIEELKVEIKNAESGAPSSVGAAGGLEAELTEITEKDTKLHTRITELESEIRDSLRKMSTLRGQLVHTQRNLARAEAELASRTYELNDSYSRPLRELEEQTNNTNKVLQKKAGNLELELKVQKDLLRDAQEADKKMPKTAETSNKFLRKTLETLELIKSAARKRGSDEPAPGSTEHLEQLMANCAHEIITGADALAKRTEELEKQNAIVNDLQERLKLAEARPASNSADQLASQQELEYLKRENKLMASAFHDMAGRLQMNTVSLQRRNEPPRSWMNKMRRQLEQPAMVRSR